MEELLLENFSFALIHYLAKNIWLGYSSFLDINHLLLCNKFFIATNSKVYELVFQDCHLCWSGEQL